MAVISGLWDQDHRTCFGCKVSHSEITPIEQLLAKLTEPFLEFSKLAEAKGKKVACQFTQSGV